ncbi:MAG: NAD(P)H-dependent oxidoreductase [Ilumatobacteraceae bacterium]|nr:NAD(P)H-dependent oxidoreductase [Ilumatobacteraceae bacterium]
MLVALILAHPQGDSYCHSLAERAAAGLRAGGHEVVVVDLYGQGFRAAMTGEERSAYHGDEPICDPLVEASADLIGRAEALVFVYPTWWTGLPAILKGWLERVMVPGVAFRFDERSGKVRPALSNIRHIVGVSTYEETHSAVRITNDNGRRTITRALRVNCGFRTRTHWFGIFDVFDKSDLERREFAGRVERELTELR